MAAVAVTPLGWLALAGAFAVLLLPAPVVARTAGLSAGGRLTVSGSAPAGRWSVASAAGRRWPAGVGAVLVLGAVAVCCGPALAVAALAVGTVGVVTARDVVSSRRARRRQRALLTAVRALASELAAGARPGAALTAAAAIDHDARALLGAAADAEAGGGDAAPVLSASADPALRGLGVAWRLAATEGAALAEVVERVGIDLAARDTARRAVTVAVAGPTSSAWLLSGLPLIGIALGAAMGARPLAFLLADPAGRLVCCAGVLLDAAGVLWLRRLVRGVQL